MQNLTKWGGALIELSQFQSVPDAKNMLTGILIVMSRISNCYYFALRIY